jgi:O-antigen ligase
VAPRSLRLLALQRRDALTATAVAAAMALLTAAGVHVLGTTGLLLPLALICAVILITRPVLTLLLVVGLAIFCEGPGFGLFSFTSDLYTQIYRGLSLLDLLVALVVVSALLNVLRSGRPLWIPRALTLALAMLVLAMAAGAFVGHEAGTSVRFSIFSEHVLFYLLLMPVAIANLELDERQVTTVLAGGMGLAIVKAVVGLVEISEHLGKPIEGSSTLTYYEPTANWVIMIAVLTILAALVKKVKPPLWVLLGSPLLLACLLLSYRRSFWIATVLGAVLILLLGTSPTGRRLLIPAGLMVAAAVWLLGSIHFQSNLPIVKRVDSLSFEKLEANREDRYRLDERANVLAEIRAHPITGLGVGVPWQATARPLSVEHEEGREYVHFAALWFWLKLGVLGLCAYAGTILGSFLLAWRTRLAVRRPWMSAFALASACSIAGLAVMDTTASFTGVEARFTVILAAQIGLLGLLARRAALDGDRELA